MSKDKELALKEKLFELSLWVKLLKAMDSKEELTKLKLELEQLKSEKEE